MSYSASFSFESNKDQTLNSLRLLPQRQVLSLKKRE
ncbi:hypothetical protein NSTCB13_06561 [Nostoc sp. DSM 114160]|jgi:hypothetical protein